MIGQRMSPARFGTPAENPQFFHHQLHIPPMNKLLVFAAFMLPLTMTEAKTEKSPNPENLLTIELQSGSVVIELFPEDAPNHVKRIKELAREGKYDEVAFHRVIDGFMAQTGDVKFGNVKEFNAARVGTGGSDKPDLPAEFNKRKHDRGACSMARSSNPDSANSQFFICFKSAGFLDGQYTVWGQVVKGMDHIDKIKRGVPGSGSVDDPDHMVKVSVAADTKKKADAEDDKSEK